MIKDIECFSREPGLNAPSKFTNGVDDFIFEETHEARAALWKKFRRFFMLNSIFDDSVTLIEEPRKCEDCIRYDPDPLGNGTFYPMPVDGTWTVVNCKKYPKGKHLEAGQGCGDWEQT